MHHGPFGLDLRPRLGTLDRLEHRDDGIVFSPRFQAERALPHRIREGHRVENLRRGAVEPQALQPGMGEDHGVEPVLAIDLGQAGSDIAADRYDGDIGPQAEDLRPAPQRAGADTRSLRQGLQGGAAEAIARILARRHRGEGQAVMQGRRQILQRMHDEVDLAIDELLLVLDGEDADHAELMEFRLAVLVGDRRDLAQRELGLREPRLDQAHDMVGLSHRQRAAARANPQMHRLNFRLGLVRGRVEACGRCRIAPLYQPPEALTRAPPGVIPLRAPKTAACEEPAPRPHEPAAPASGRH